MTFQFLFFTITVQKRQRTMEERKHDLYVEQRMEELKSSHTYHLFL